MQLLPARAGMILMPNVNLTTVTAAPRTRGDDPPFQVGSGCTWACSPHARG